MNLRLTGVLVVLGSVSGVELLLPQTPPTPRQPPIIEWGFHGTLIVGDSSRLGVVAGPRVAVRTPGGTRGAISLGAGVMRDSASGRDEAAIEYQMASRAAGGVGVYFGGGLAGVVGAGRGEYLILYVGLEGSPGQGSGWAIEAGLGGGFRFRGAYHWRRFPRGWRPRP